MDESESNVPASDVKKKRIYDPGRTDIRYRGPLSCRAFKVLGWISIAALHVVFLMQLDTRMDPGMTEPLRIPTMLFSAFSGMAVPLFLMANYALILNETEAYLKQIFRYLGAALLVAGLSLLVYHRYAAGIAGRIFGDQALASAFLDRLLHTAMPTWVWGSPFRSSCCLP